MSGWAVEWVDGTIRSFGQSNLIRFHVPFPVFFIASEIACKSTIRLVGDSEESRSEK